jgi:putative ABC transport system substrate-binding protein
MLFGLYIRADAQQPEKTNRVGILISASSAATAPFLDSFQQGLSELGYSEGKNIAFERRFADGRLKILRDLAAELVALKVDVIVAAGSNLAVLAAKEATSTIPIVMITASDPVERGLTASLARPGGNVTGFTSIAMELDGKRLELLLEAVPRITRVAVVTTSLEPTANEHQKMKAVAKTLNVNLQILNGVRDANSIDDAFSAMARERAEAFTLLSSGGRFTLNQRRIIDHAAKNRLPAIYSHDEFVNNGGLMSYGASRVDLFRRAAIAVDKILKGAKPADLPIEQPTKFDLVINLKTAKQMRLTIPSQVLARADRVIR